MVNHHKRPLQWHNHISHISHIRLIAGASKELTGSLEITYKHDKPALSVATLFVKLGLILLSVLLSSGAWAGSFDNCKQNFYAVTAPDYLNQKLLNKSMELCFDGFATLYSGASRTPLWSAEHLTRERLYQAEQIPREDSFHSESRLPNSMQAQLADYKNSGYDRGHLAPNADMANTSQQYDSFSLANIVPQDPRNNRYSWKNIESVTRYLTKKHGEVYVVTGVVFAGKKVTQINNRILVPSHMFKAVYVPQTEQAGVYYSPNDDSDIVEIISVDELALRSGIDVFPAISSQAKAAAMPLEISLGDVSDRGDYDNKKKADPKADQEQPLWYLILIEILHWVVDNFFKK